jgi:tRNA U34 5-methylaminomethyl-2-thiouridine-forming methyltransferase MnmC
MKRFEIIQTADNSYTIKDNIINETFHSIQGAYSESMHVFINEGLLLFNNKPKVNIFEMGFGSGLNVILTLLNKDASQRIYYVTVDKYPLPESLFPDLINQFNTNNEKELYKKIMECPWNKNIHINKNFILKKILSDIETYTFDCTFDLIYYDAFSLKSQPELWSESIFKKLYNALNTNGFIVTYACNKIAKNNLKSAGFKFERLKGALNKKHMLRAKK